MQRLVAKEKLAVQLQAELNRLKSVSPNASRDAVRSLALLDASRCQLTTCFQEERTKHERDKIKWNALLDEIADLKTKVVYRFSVHFEAFLTRFV